MVICVLISFLSTLYAEHLFLPFFLPKKQFIKYTFFMKKHILQHISHNKEAFVDIEDIQVFGVNMSFISLSEVKKFYIS